MRTAPAAQTMPRWYPAIAFPFFFIKKNDCPGLQKHSQETNSIFSVTLRTLKGS